MAPGGQYRVTFYRTVANEVGDCFDSDLETVEVAIARSRERALMAAQRKFARHHNVHRWDDLAHGFKLQEEARR
jgi:hypothetical protein